MTEETSNSIVRIDKGLERYVRGRDRTDKGLRRYGRVGDGYDSSR